MRRTSWLAHPCALAGYAVLAIVFSWPLAAQLSTHLTSPPGGDAGVYVWNQWAFRHQVLEHRANPYFTSEIFAASSRANLSLHNYTAFADLLALPLIGSLGVVTTFNLIYLLMTVLSAYAMWLLARSVTGSGSVAWLAGALFAWSPWFIARSDGQYSLVAAAPLPIFILLLHRVMTSGHWGHAIGLGVTLAWAFACDVYFAVYCVIIACVQVGWRALNVSRRATTESRRLALAASVLHGLIACAAGLVAALLLGDGGRFTVLGVPVSVRSLHTPVLVLTALVLARVALAFKATVSIGAVEVRQFIRLTSYAGLTAAVLLSPVLYAAALRIVDGRFEVPPAYWRSSPGGADLLAFLIPNPHHPLAPEGFGRWIAALPGPDLESVASIPLVALGVLLVAWRRGWRMPAFWAGSAVVFVLCSLGPFIQIGGLNTHVPGPWALLRYVPLLGLARSPSRQVVLVMLVVAILFACALQWMAIRAGRQRPVLLAGVGLLLAFELMPAPRLLHSAAVPSVYALIAADPRANASVLELPFGVRDGASSAGDFTARSQFFQTSHQKRLIGGYLSRVSRRRVAEYRGAPVRGALIALSERRPLSEREEAAALWGARSFVKRSSLAFVVVDETRASPELVEFATRAFGLVLVARDGTTALYVPSVDDL